MTTSTAVALSLQPAIVAISSVSEWPATNSEISFAARRQVPASSTTPAANSRWSQPPIMWPKPSVR